MLTSHQPTGLSLKSSDGTLIIFRGCSSDAPALTTFHILRTGLPAIVSYLWACPVRVRSTKTGKSFLYPIAGRSTLDCGQPCKMSLTELLTTWLSARVLSMSIRTGTLSLRQAWMLLSVSLMSGDYRSGRSFRAGRQYMASGLILSVRTSANGTCDYHQWLTP